MANPEPDRTSPRDDGSTPELEAHLEREESLLAATLDSLRGVRAAIVSADWERLPALLGFQERLGADAREVARHRDSLRVAIAGRSGVPASEVTLRSAAAALSPQRASALLAGRDRLSGMAREAETIRRSIDVLVRHSLDFHQKMLEGLTGGRSPARYSAAGTWRGVAFGSLIQGRG